MSNGKRWIVLMATPEEDAKFNKVKEEYAIHQDAAMLRFLINQEHKKILAKNVSKEQNTAISAN